jgi:hypothetical protein
MSLYVEVEIYDVLVTTVASELPRCPWTGGADINTAKLLIGARLDIWPRSIYADAVAHGHA